jgi:thiol-disulfide isomerase/thioredoxin
MCGRLRVSVFAGWLLSAVLTGLAEWPVDAAAPITENGQAPMVEPSARSWMQQASALLIRDPVVRQELRLRPAQVEQIDLLQEKADRVLWGLRDLPIEESNQKARPVIEQFEDRTAAVLDAIQNRRLRQIVLQAGASESLVRPEVAGVLKLSAEQQEKISRIAGETRTASEALDVLAREGKPRETLDRLARALRVQERQNVSAVLSDGQRRQWTVMLGPPFDFSRVASPAFRAPELQPGNAWINSEPLTLVRLRGKVVILNFYTFGCGNCINNYPVYKRWYEAYNGKGVVILGIHTPETQGERNVDAVRRKAADSGLAWPILVDNAKANWNAWSNNVWPSVYLIDKRGIIRAWWYGELNWQKTPGEKIMTARIDQLLAEPWASTSQPAVSPVGGN